LDNLRQTVLDNNPYWHQDWDGTFSLPSLLIFCVNFFLILLGISLSWKMFQLPGVTPLAVFMFYNLSNALARTSGGRYIVPTDWIITIYFLLGIFHIITRLANAVRIPWKIEAESAGRDGDHIQPARLAIPFAFAILFGLGALVPLSERLHPDRYQNFDIHAALHQNELAMSKAGLSMNSVEAFLQEKDASIIVGRALYPRYYKQDRGEFIFYYPTLKLPFPRTTFTVIGPGFDFGVILPGGVPAYFPHASDVIVIGCRQKEYVDALAVIVVGEQGSVYTRAPESKLTCPLQQPVCNNNSVCR
jgi:hypothetical protein